MPSFFFITLIITLIVSILFPPTGLKPCLRQKPCCIIHGLFLAFGAWYMESAQ
jgi:hypothetical protein